MKTDPGKLFASSYVHCAEILLLLPSKVMKFIDKGKRAIEHVFKDVVYFDFVLIQEPDSLLKSWFVREFVRIRIQCFCLWSCSWTMGRWQFLTLQLPCTPRKPISNLWGKCLLSYLILPLLPTLSNWCLYQDIQILSCRSQGKIKQLCKVDSVNQVSAVLFSPLMQKWGLEAWSD